jgi:hypothetical protein
LLRCSSAASHTSFYPGPLGSDATSDADRRHATDLYLIAQEGLLSGLYTPNRSSFLCSQVLGCVMHP